MIQKLIVTFCILLYAVGSLYLEINNTHVFNPVLTPHFRIHEAWQLITNSSIGVVCLWLVWKQEKIIFGAFLSLVIMSSFLAAYALKGTYGGAMKYSDGSENFLFGINFGFAVSGLIAILLILSIFLEYRRLKNA
jgi:hypothetical protein